MAVETWKSVFGELTGLEEHEEESEEAGKDDAAGRSGETLVVPSNDGEVRTLGCPQRRGAQSDEHRRRDHRAPDSVAVGGHVHDVAAQRDDNRPPMSDASDHQFRREHARQHKYGVEDAHRYNSEPFGPVQRALQSAETLERVEVEQKRDADDHHVLPDSPLLASQLGVVGPRLVAGGAGASLHRRHLSSIHR